MAKCRDEEEKVMSDQQPIGVEASKGRVWIWIWKDRNWQEINSFSAFEMMVGSSAQTTATTNESRPDMDKNKKNYM